MRLALIVSIILQFIAAGYAFSLIRKTKYNISWVFISVAFLLMAFRRVIDLIPFLDRDYKIEMEIMSKWVGIFNSLLIVLGSFYLKKVFDFIDRINDMRTKSERRVLDAIVRTEEKERRRFAKELHDGLGPLLSSAKLSASALGNSKDHELNKEIAKNINLVVNEAINSIKEISNNLSPHVLENFGLANATQDFIDKINSLKKLNISFKHNIHSERFNNNIEVILYRIVNELITNTIKHANAKRIDVEFYKSDEILFIYFADDGIGFNTSIIMSEENSGMGYSNIFSRLKTLNGQIDLHSAHNKGVNIRISVPVNL